MGMHEFPPQAAGQSIVPQSHLHIRRAQSGSQYVLLLKGQEQIQTHNKSRAAETYALVALVSGK